MGIPGLLPFLKKSSKNTHLRHHSGSTAAVDGFGWLHKGAFGCAVKLGMKEPTDAYVLYFMKHLNVLLEHKIKPVVVFDGRSLPAKAPTDAKRRASRADSLKKALQLVRKGDKKASWEYFVKAISITHAMVLDVIRVLRQKHIDYIVAPFEADAQLAYLARHGFVDFVVTEDSDLVAFGCPQILFKLKETGDCVLFTQEKVHICMDVPKKQFKFDHFRYMCILVGCDYLESLPKIGLVRAKKIISAMMTAGDDDIVEAIRKIPNTLSLDIKVTDEYIEEFLKANNSFLYALVFDPVERRVKPLTPYPEGVDKEEFSYAGTYDLSDEEFLDIALGNINTKTLERVDSYNIDKDKGYATRESSMWSKKYQKVKFDKSDEIVTEPKSLKGAMVPVNATRVNKKKRPLASNAVNSGGGESDDLTAVYGEGATTTMATVSSSSTQQDFKRTKRMSIISHDTSELRACKNPFGDACSDEEKHAEADGGDVAAALNGMSLRKQKKNPFLKSPDIGKRARSKIVNGNSQEDISSLDSEKEGQEELTVKQPVCLIEKNRIYDFDRNIIVKSKYFREAAKSESSCRNATSSSNSYELEYSQVASQLSIYSVDKDDIRPSDSNENTPDEDPVSPETATDIGETENVHSATEDITEIVELEDEEEEQSSTSSYFSNKAVNGIKKDTPERTRLPKKTPPSTRGKPKSSSCRSQGLKKPQKTDASQRTLLQMFGYQAKPKV